MLIDVSGDNPYVPVYSTMSLALLMEYFSSGIRRATIVNLNKVVVNSISQSDMIYFIAQHIGETQVKGKVPLQSRSLDYLGYTESKGLVTIQHTTTVLEVLMRCGTLDTLSFPIVDEEGRLVGNLSALDLGIVFLTCHAEFLLSVRQFLSKHHPKSLQPLCVTKDTTLGTTLQLLCKHRVHHLWVVDKEAKPIGILTLTIILILIASKK